MFLKYHETCKVLHVFRANELSVEFKYSFRVIAFYYWTETLLSYLLVSCQNNGVLQRFFIYMAMYCLRCFLIFYLCKYEPRSALNSLADVKYADVILTMLALLQDERISNRVSTHIFFMWDTCVICREAKRDKNIFRSDSGRIQAFWSELDPGSDRLFSDLDPVFVRFGSGSSKSPSGSETLESWKKKKTFYEMEYLKDFLPLKL